jgi:Putative peptidoglycan binding domain
VSAPKRLVGWVAIGVVLVAGGGLWVATGDRGDQADADTTSEAERNTGEVETRDLARTADYDGTLGYGDAKALPGNAGGTVTWTPEVGSVIEPGEVLYEVDGLPVVLLPGEVPAYRRLAYAEGPGDDVQQLEQFLVDAGFAGDDLVIDTEWTSATTTAVQAWQDSLGLETTGEIDLGRIVFWPTSLRVDSVTAGVGERAEGSVLSVTGTTEVVSVDVDASESGRLPLDTEVTVSLDGGPEVSGTVTEVGEAETSSDQSSFPGADDGSGSTVPITITLDAGAPTESLGAGTSATVTLTLETAEDVTAVPVSALLALAEGGYAVEVVDGTGASAPTHLVGVELGMFADGWVEVTGDLAAGDSVVVP